MHIKPVIYTTTNPLSAGRGYWFEQLFNSIYKTVTLAKGVTIDRFQIVHWSPTEKIKKRKDKDGDIVIDWEWFAETFTKKSKGYNTVIFHTTSYWRKKWGLSTYINGVYRVDRDEYTEIYICADTLSEFLRLMLHELGHPLERLVNGGEPVRTFGCNKWYNYHVHKADYCDDDLESFYKSLDLTRYSLISQLYRAMVSLFNLLKIDYPVEDFKYRVSQRFGIHQPQRRSGIHNGLDLALPIGTYIKAWVNLEIYKVVENHKTMGNMCEIRFVYKGNEYYARLLHLLEAPKIGFYTKGMQIARSGNSGESTGPHLHLELWRVPIDIKLLYTENSVRSNLIDPYKFFLYEVDGVII